MAPPRPKRPTLREVADHAGVSTATVSLVVNGKAKDAGITESTQAEVYKAIEALQYTPNRMASAVVTGRSRIVGVMSALSRELFDTKFGTRVLSGFAKGARDLGYHFVLLEDVLSTKPDGYDEVVKRAREMCVEGLLLLVDIGQEEQFRKMEERISQALPISNVQFTFDPDGIPGFRVDHANTAKEVVDYLVAQGHRRIGFGARRTDLFRAQASIRLIAGNLERHGVPFDPEMIFEIPPWSQMDLFVEKVRQKNPTALFCLYDGEAVRAAGSLREAGFRVPEDLSIIGYGDSPLTQDVFPTLTTFRPPMEQIGEAAIRHLIGCIEERSDPTLKSSRDLGGELIVRGSSGPAPRP